MSVIAAALLLAQGGVVVGDLRIQVLSPSLIRIEQKGPEGFEDRPTFHIANRTGWPYAKVSVKTKDGMCVIWADDWQIFVDLKAKTLADASIWSRDSHGKGKPIFDYDPAHPVTNSAWLPTPGHMPRSWAIADSPRLIPAPQGLTPDGQDPTSGWDVKNDAPDLYVFLPHSYAQLRKEFLHLTGPIEMPPLYALGYTDSRYYAYEQKEALARMDEYRKRQIPIDTFVVDTDWRVGGSHGYEVDTKLFPDMPGFFKSAHDKHIHVMFNDHPEPQSKSALDPNRARIPLEQPWRAAGGRFGHLVVRPQLGCEPHRSRAGPAARGLGHEAVPRHDPSRQADPAPAHHVERRWHRQRLSQPTAGHRHPPLSRTVDRRHSLRMGISAQRRGERRLRRRAGPEPLGERGSWRARGPADARSLHPVPAVWLGLPIHAGSLHEGANSRAVGVRGPMPSESCPNTSRCGIG